MTHPDLLRLYNQFLEHPMICTDTRQIIPGSIFFALKGDRFDGNQYAAKAISGGCSLAVVDDPKVASGNSYLVVTNVLTTLQDLARHHRRQFNIPVLAITGSNGKTTSKELIYEVISRKWNTLATVGNLNNHIGVPLTLLRLKQETEFAIIEMGANHIGEIKTLCEIAEPGYGLITNIGFAHLEGFGSPEGVLKAKSEMYDYLRSHQGTCFVNAQDDTLMHASETLSRITFGGNQSVIQGSIQPSDDLKLHVEWVLNGEHHHTGTHLTGAYNLSNILAAIAIGHHFQVDASEIHTALSSYIPTNNRSQIIKTETNTVILDAYNANPSSMQAALESLNMQRHPNTWVFLGDMLELGDRALQEHTHILHLLQEKRMKNVVLVGPLFRSVANHLPFHVFETTQAAKEWILTHPINKALILIKGSRKMGLEAMVEVV